MTDDFDKSIEPWEEEDMLRLRKGLEEHPLGGSLEGVKPGEVRKTPRPVRLFPDGPIIGWV